MHRSDLAYRRNTTIRTLAAYTSCQVSKQSLVNYLNQKLHVSITEKPSPLSDKNNVYWAPSLNLGRDKVHRISTERYKRAKHRERHRRFVQDTAKDEVLDEGEKRCVTLDTTTETTDDACETRRVTTIAGTQTLRTIDSVETLENLKAHNASLHEKIEELQQRFTQLQLASTNL